MDLIDGPWSLEEDEMLINLFLLPGSNWSLISNSIPGKSDEACLSRWLSLLGKGGFMDQTAGRWSPEEDEMLLNLIEKHGYNNWSLISKSIPGKSPAKCWARQRLLAKNDTDQIERLWSSEEDEIDEDEIEMLPKLVEKHGPNSSPPVITISDHNTHDLTLRLAVGGVSDQAPSNGDMAMETGSQNSIYEGNSSHEVGGMVSGQPPSISDMARGNMSSGGTHSYSHDHSAPRLSNGGMAMDTGSQNSIYEWNSSHEVGGVVSGRAPPISDMARENMSSGGTHSYSRDHSAPSWNVLYKRDSSPMMIDSDSVQQFVGSEFGRKDFSEVSSTSLLQGKGW